MREAHTNKQQSWHSVLPRSLPAGNTAPIDALCQALAKRQLQPVPVFVSSLRDPDVQEELLSYFQPKDSSGLGYCSIQPVSL
jgi:cobalamin biosynthesis Mg chelatase CobN